MFKNRFSVLYKISGNEKDAYAKAKGICLEQTVEFPDELIPNGIIRDHILGKIESFSKNDSNSYCAVISFAVATTGNELPQLLNVVFGNISIKHGIRVEHLELPQTLLKFFKGPRFGRNGLRRLLKIKKRPLLCTALKPMGLSSQKLAELSYQFVCGGIDIIKDDHGLTNQNFAPFEERVRLCAKAVCRANQETKQDSIYVANISASADEIFKRAKLAKKYGAGGLLVSPGLVGLDTMRKLADDDSIALPIITHPAFQGTYVLNPTSGISHQVLFGQIARLAGADATIYPNFGGRFAFSKEECMNIVKGTSVKMGKLKPIFPCPGGGMDLNRVKEILEIYGQEVILLMGGSLFSHSSNLIENCRYFRKLIEK